MFLRCYSLCSIIGRFVLHRGAVNPIFLSACLMAHAGVVLADVFADREITIGAYVGNNMEVKVYQKGGARFMHSRVFENMGYRLKIINQPYLRSLQLANAGYLDGTAIFTLDKGVDLYGKDPNLSVSTKPHIASDLVLYTKKGNAKAVRQNITNVSVGIMRVLPNAVGYLKKIGIEPHVFKDYTSLFQVLEAGRVDAILVPSFLYQVFINESYIEDKYEFVKSFGCLKGYMAFSIEKFGRQKANELAEEHGRIISKLRERKSGIFYFDC